MNGSRNLVIFPLLRTLQAASPRKFSTQWKNFSPFFHTMEKMFPQCGKLGFRAVFGGFGCSLGAVERSTRRPLSTVERDRPRGQEKRRPTQSGSALSRARLGCGVVARPFFWPRGRGSSRSQVRRPLRMSVNHFTSFSSHPGRCGDEGAQGRSTPFKRLKIDSFVVGGAGLPTAVDDPDPLER